MKAILAAIAIAAAVPASAITITFDDLSGGGSPIANGYAGLNWNNFFTVNGTNFTGSGYHSGTVSPDNVAFNAFSNPATLSSSTTFSLTRGYFTGAWYDGLTIQAVGTLGGSAVYTQSFIVNASAPTLVTLNHALVDNVVFSSFGGTAHPGYGGCCTHFALDNLTVNGAVPEPASWALMLSGFAFVGAALRRRVTTATFA